MALTPLPPTQLHLRRNRLVSVFLEWVEEPWRGLDLKSFHRQI